MFFLQWFEGENVRQWAYGILGTIGSPNQSPYLTNWNALLGEAARLWGPINEPQMARDQLRSIEQEKTVSDYHAKFTRWAALTGYNEEALVDAFYKGLKTPIKDMMVNIARPRSVGDTLSVALQFENRILNRAQERRKEPGPRGRNIPPRQGLRADVKAMKLSPEERTKRLKEGLCFRCAQKGHLARTCPQKIKTARVEKAKPKKEGEEAKQEEEEENQEDF
jgi:Retrotransposon gag protein/Zinc knuckle